MKDIKSENDIIKKWCIKVNKVTESRFRYIYPGARAGTWVMSGHMGSQFLDKPPGYTQVDFTYFKKHYYNDLLDWVEPIHKKELSDIQIDNARLERILNKMAP